MAHACESWTYQRFDNLLDQTQILPDRSPALTGPVRLVETSSSWDSLDAEAKKKYETERFSNLCDWGESSSNLLGGAVNLINLVFNEPVETLVFMDKSARLAGYIFDNVWKQVQTRLGSPVEKPMVRYLNSGHPGNEKFKYWHPKEQLAKIYDHRDFDGKKILLVDEYIHEGHTVRNAAAALLTAGYQPAVLKGVAMFGNLPSWYFQDPVKGVVETNSMSEKDMMAIASLPVELINQVKKLHQIFGPKKMLSAFEWIYWKHARADDYQACVWSALTDDLTPLQVRELEGAEIDLKSIIKTLYLESLNRGTTAAKAVDYFTSRGGFLAVPPKEEDLKHSIIYRQTLRYVVEEAFRRGLIEINQSV